LTLGAEVSYLSAAGARKGSAVIKLAVWAFIAYLGYRACRNVAAAWKLMKGANPPRQPPQGRRPVEAQFEVEEGK
jgi:hypothetical protein